MRLPKKELFSSLFDSHYKGLYNYSFKVLGQKSTSEELVQETFIKLWEHIDRIKTDKRAIESFLIVTLKNKIIDAQRKNAVRTKHNNSYFSTKKLEEEMDTDWEISQQITQIYDTLPPKTVTIFQLSRNRGMTYAEIADREQISIKTVESHISKALVAFRKGLKDYL
ncbi:MAG: sigma-70 family RNA polymerase sigma factor [Cellulophaga sp.]